MEADRASVGRVELLLEALFLEYGIDTKGAVGKAALQWIAEWLHLDPWFHFGAQTLAHLVAIQLAPRTALTYQSSNPKPRWRLVYDYLKERFRLDDAECERISRLVSAILDSAATTRGPQIISIERALSCAICRMPFDREPTSVRNRDPYKPVWMAPVELCRPEIDHVVPISGLGAHVEGNMQIICRACNLAKGSGLTIDPIVEVRHAGQDLQTVPRVHLFRLLQWLIQTRNAECKSCDSASSELTMRPIHPQAPLARSTVTLRCYDCLNGT